MKALPSIVYSLHTTSYPAPNLSGSFYPLAPVVNNLTPWFPKQSVAFTP